MVFPCVLENKELACISHLLHYNLQVNYTRQRNRNVVHGGYTAGDGRLSLGCFQPFRPKGDQFVSFQQRSRQ